MTVTPVSLTKTLALAAISHLAFAPASFAADSKILNDSGAIISGLQNLDLETSKSEDMISAALQAAEEVPAQIKEEEISKVESSTEIQKLNKEVKQETSYATKADKLIKYGIISAGMAAGAALTYFYGSALAATLAYEGSLALASWMMPNQSLMQYYFVTQPAAINTAMQFANSTLVKGALGLASTGLGSGLGWAGSMLYEGAKHAGSTAGSAVSSLAAKAGSATYNMTTKAGSAVVDATKSAASVALNTAASTVSKVSETAASAVKSGWSWLTQKAASFIPIPAN